MKLHLLRTALFAALMVTGVRAQAEDIDLFVNATPAAAELPNVLFIVDNTANWSQAFENEMSALAGTFAGLPANKFRIGIMFATETSSADSNVGGGYVRAAIRTMSDANKDIYRNLILNLDKLDDKGNSGFSGVQMAEAYRYFTGGAPYSGNRKAKTDYLGNTCSECNMKQDVKKNASRAVYDLPDNALDSKNATAYNSPVLANCVKNYIIYISNGPNQESSSQDEIANNMLRAANGSTSMIALSPNGSQENPADEWARFMKASDLKVQTYTIDVNPVTTGQGPGWTALLRSMANVSGGKYTAVSSGNGGAQISDAINKALSEIQSVNTVFASVSLPVSVNTQGTYLNQVFVGMFRPDATAAPRWVGNLKQYKLGLEGTEIKLKDADGNGAINNSTGFITECARSFWTPTTPDAYWIFKPQGACIPPPGSDVGLYQNSNFPDGNVVEKGAQAYQLRSASSRLLKTCAPIFSACENASGGLSNFDTANTGITSALLGTTAAERDNTINWGRGKDIDNERPGSTTSDMRPSAHGDVVHSRPVALNFGSDASPKVVVFYGGNDGIFRAVNGNRSSNIGSFAAGQELWSFMPPEFYGSIKRLRGNAPPVKLVNSVAADAQPKPYGVDGAVTAHFDGTRAWIYTTMRRGARVLYAFNVNVNNPADITLKWKKGCPRIGSDSDCSTGFSGLGQTWSQPKVMNAVGESSPLLIMGGGYDNCEDNDPNTCGASSKGNQIYVLDADTGALRKSFPTARGVIADVIVVPDPATGFAKYAYAADLGGNVYRLTFGNSGPASWTMVKIASLGCATADSSCSNNRKFMFVPDVVVDNGRYVILLGSGDREKPLLTYTGATSVANYFFAIKDDPADANWLPSESGNCGSAVICLASLLNIPYNSPTPDASQLNAKKGWYLGLNSTEQVVTSAITIFGTVNFSTHEPEPRNRNACTSALGKTRVYNINFKNASPTKQQRFTVLPPVGLPPSPVAGIVTLDEGNQVAFCIGCDADSPLEAEQPQLPLLVTPTEPKARVYWFLQQ